MVSAPPKPAADQVKAIESFREVEWPNIKRQLRTDFQTEVEVEPHWVEPGRAVYWRRLIVRKREQTEGPDGEPIWKAFDEDQGWQSTDPLPANGASVIYRYLSKGFRLRPPSSDVEAPNGVEAAVPAEGEEKLTHQKRFWCHRHPSGQVGFVTWKGYARHCEAKGEILQEKPPDEVQQHMASFEFFCLMHLSGFKALRMAKRHLRSKHWNSQRERATITLKSLKVRVQTNNKGE